ncbi:MAG TPA: DNA-directed RNA polymerase [Methanomassiliicoccales archaeon]|nr:DNA-directed RNA polymerase [Methanomassiliicoccales archaeon]
MYLMAKREKVVRIPPDRLAEDLDATVVELAKESLEGKVEGSDSLTVLIRNIRREGPGRIVHGDGAVYQKVTFDSLIFRPVLQEVVEGTVVEVLKFGAFVRFGPLDGLLHISQIMDDRIDVDDVNQRLLGKDTKRDLKVGDKVRARVVALSINERNPRESKIGLTMRQAGLGKFEWLEEDRKKKGEKEKGAAA